MRDAVDRQACCVPRVPGFALRSGAGYYETFHDSSKSVDEKYLNMTRRAPLSITHIRNQFDGAIQQGQDAIFTY
jgi:hypothetical protein